MQTYYLRRSAVDPEFLEIVLEGVVIQEVRVLFQIPGSRVSFSCLDEVLVWLQETEYKLAKASAYRLLARRSYPKLTLLQKLREKKYSEIQCRKVIGEIEKLGYLSDEDYGEKAVSQKINQGYGPKHIERYLQGLGLNPRLAREKMDEEKQKEALKKWEHKLRGKEKKKRIAFLIRRGFDFSMIQNLCM
jgi:SOS response regulatory protein OraA/RecX